MPNPFPEAFPVVRSAVMVLQWLPELPSGE